MSGTAKTPKTYDAKAVKALAAIEYDREAKTNPSAILPAAAKRTLAAKTGLPVSRLASLVDPVYFEKNGRRFPIPLAKARTEKSLGAAVRKRRDAGGTLGRWESVASALSEALGRPVSEAAVRALYSASGADLEASYVGRGTRIAAPKTRESETAELVA